MILMFDKLLVDKSKQKKPKTDLFLKGDKCNLSFLNTETLLKRLPHLPDMEIDTVYMYLV